MYNLQTMASYNLKFTKKQQAWRNCFRCDIVEVMAMTLQVEFDSGHDFQTIICNNYDFIEFFGLRNFIILYKVMRQDYIKQGKLY